MREDGLRRFTEAEELIEDRIETLEARAAEGSISASYAERQLAIASYGLARTRYFHALLYNDGDPEQEKVLEKAIDGFSNFALDYGDFLQSYEGLVYQGLCDKRLGDTETALDDFDGAIALREGYLTDAQGVYGAPPEAVDIISWAVQEKMRLLNEGNEPAQALAVADDYFKTLPDPLQAARGLAVLFAAARGFSHPGEAPGLRVRIQAHDRTCV